MMLPEVGPNAVEPAGVVVPAEPDGAAFVTGRRASTSSFAVVARAVRQSPSAMIGLGILVALVLIALLAPVIAPYGINAQAGKPFTEPSAAHPLGLDDGGYDVLSLLMWGLRVSLLVGFAATFVASGVGSVVGIVAGYFGRAWDTILMRITDYFLVIPALPLMISVADIWGPSLFHTIVVIGVLSWTVTALVVRAQARTVKERVYVKRERSIGASHPWIISHHVLPQLVPLIVANTVLNISYAIFLETALAFLGLGDPSLVSLGTMIQHAFLASAVVQGAWWAIVPPGVLVAIIILACSLFGRAIEDAFNPRLRAVNIGARSFTRVRAGDGAR
jgi:peptide/nickel transport system permease protein